MFDPTVFENLKVAFENHLYDLDNIDEKIGIIDRKDWMDLAVLKRVFSIQFFYLPYTQIQAEIILVATLEDLAAEILDKKDPDDIGCTLIIKFEKVIEDVERQCSQIEKAIFSLWENEVHLNQTLSFEFGSEPSILHNEIEVEFKQKIREGNMREIGDFLQHVFLTIEVLSRI